MKLRCFVVFLCVVLLISSNVLCVNAAVYRGNSYSYNDYGEVIPAPESYVPSKVIYGCNLGISEFNKPLDMCGYDNGLIIADTENNRIVIVNKDLELEKEIKAVTISNKEQLLSKPEGVFYADNGYLYICDTGNGRVLKTDMKGDVLTEYIKPETELLEEDFVYEPQKVAVDTAGNVYVIAKGIYQGFVEYDSSGEFNGFFGGNKIELTASALVSYYWKKLLSKEQGQAMTRLIPIQYANLFIDSQDFIYTVTSVTDTSKNEIKKLSALGNNILHFSDNGLYDKSDFGDLEKGSNKGVEIDTRFVDLCVDSNGFITALDSERGRIFQYDGNCQLLSIFGNKGEKEGTFKNPCALIPWKNGYAVLDNEKNSITLFTPTEYNNLLLEAVKNYNHGEYEASLSTWNKLLEKNCALSIAYRGIGRTYLRKGEYKIAMEYLDKGNDREGYSEALGGYRKQVIRQNTLWVVLICATAYITVKIGKKYLPKKTK